MANLKKAREFHGKSQADPNKTRLLLAVCRDVECDAKLRISKKLIKTNKIPFCGCGSGEFLVQSKDFD